MVSGISAKDNGSRVMATPSMNYTIGGTAAGKMSSRAAMAKQGRSAAGRGGDECLEVVDGGARERASSARNSV